MKLREKKWFVLAPVLTLALGWLATAQGTAQTTIGTPDNNPGGIQQWGIPSSAAYGQTFIAPTGTGVLQSFTFSGVTAETGLSLNYQTYIFAFNPLTATQIGTALYTGAVQTVPAAGTVSSTVTPNLVLAPGQTYIILVTAYGVAQTNTTTASMDGSSGAYANGSFYFTNDTTITNGLVLTPWNLFVVPETAFSAVFGPLALNLANLTPNQQNVARNLNGMATRGTPSADFINHLFVPLALTSFTNYSAYAADLDALSPQKLEVFRNIAFDNFGFTANQLDDHLASLRFGQGGFDTSGLQVLDSSDSQTMAQLKGRLLAWSPPSNSGTVSDTAGPMFGGVNDSKDMKEMAPPEVDQNRFSAFISGSVILGDVSHTADTSYSNYTTGGVTAGADYRIDKHWAIGGIIGYGHTGINLDNNGSTGRVDSYSPGVYGTFVDQGWFANGLFAYDYNTYNETRVIPFMGRTAGASPDGNQFNGDLDGGYEFHSGDLTFGPTAAVQYVHLDINGFTETGAGAADLNVNEQQDDSLRTRLGGEFHYKWSWYGGKVIATPHLSASWQHECLDNSDGITSQFDGQGLGSFSVQTDRPDRDSAFIDAGIDTQWNSAFDLFLDYQTQVGQDNFYAQSIEGGMKVGF